MDRAMMKKAGDRLRDVRRLMGISQKELGELLGFGRENINGRELGKSEIRAEFAVKVSEVAKERFGIEGIAPEYLMGMSDRMADANANTIPKLVERAHANAVEKGFWKKPPELGTSLALIHGELSEALEEARDGHALDETYFRKDGKPEGFPSELADTVIRIFDICGYYRINLEAAILQKMAFNRTRPEKHGKQF
jgi:transcriptional regulator with XRE-family HTH domain